LSSVHGVLGDTMMQAPGRFQRRDPVSYFGS
jgi:hypothetical protein